MSVQVEPYQLRFLASRLSAGAQEICLRSNRLESIMNELVQGSWKGEGAHAFAVKCEVMKGEMQKTADVLDSAVNVLNRFANQMERVNQLRQQANMLEQQSWQYGGDSIDDLHHRQNLARQAAQIRQEAEWEANAVDAQTANEFQMIISMIPQFMEQMGQYMGSNGNTDKLNDLPEPLRSYYLRHKDLLHDDEGETAATLTMGSYKQADYDGVKQYVQDHESENETWYEKTWDWMKAEGREFVVDYKQHWKTGNIWYDEANYWLLGIPDNVKRVFHTRPFSLENWEANLDLFISVVPSVKLESGAIKVVEGASKDAEEITVQKIFEKDVSNLTEKYLGNIETNNIVVKNADDINQWWETERGYLNPPYTPGTKVLEFELDKPTTFVRVYDDVNSFKKGGWLMKAEDLKGLTPEEIRDKYALPQVPKYIVDVRLDAGSKLRIGEANELPNWGKGGGIQLDMMGQNIGEFVNPRELK